MQQPSNSNYLEGAAKEAWERTQKKLGILTLTEKFKTYRDDPYRFGVEVLGEDYTDDVRQVMYSVRDNPITIAKSANAVGKSHAAARICAWFYLCFDDSQVYVAAAPPLENLKKILWGQIATITRNHPELFYDHRIRTLHIGRPYVIKGEESFITGVTIPTSGTSAEREGKFSGKHAPHLLFVVDEGDAVPDEVYRGIESCMSGGIARLLIMFNPRAQSGTIYHKEKARQANIVQMSAFRHPNVVTGTDVFPGAVTRDITVRRINEWTRELAPAEKKDGSCFEVPDFLVNTTATALDGRTYPPLPPGTRRVDPAFPEFNYMVLGQYPAQSAFQLINRDWIDAAETRWLAYVAKFGEIPPPNIQPRLGLDVAEYGSDSNVIAPRYGGFVSRLITWRGMDIDSTALKALQIYEDLQAQLILVDGTGVGAGVAPNIARRSRDKGGDARAVGIKVAEKPSPLFKTEKGEFRQMRDQLLWMAREWLRADTGAMLPPDPQLRDELLTPEYEIKNGRIVVTSKDVMRERLRRSPDRLDALCLTFAPFSRPRWVNLGESIQAQHNTGFPDNVEANEQDNKRPLPGDDNETGDSIVEQYLAGTRRIAEDIVVSSQEGF